MKQELVAYLIRDNERVWDMPTDGLLVALDQLMQANITQEQSSRLRVFADGEAGHADTRGRVSSETFVKQAGSLNLTKSFARDPHCMFFYSEHEG